MRKNWLIPLLCILPFLGIILWFLAGKNMGNLLTFGLFLACPLSHFFLMKHSGLEAHHETGGDKHETS